MKTLALTIILTTNAIIGIGQNLISNSSFEGGFVLINCQGWYDGCGNELTISCDSTPYCHVGFHQESPSPSLSEFWSLALDAGFPSEGFAETYITGQSGTQIYQLKFWMKSAYSHSYGYASIGTGSQNQFIASKTVSDTTVNWKQYTLIDTLTTQINDTIAVRLSAGIFDFGISGAYFDLIQLTILDTLTSIENVNQFENEGIKIYPNPSIEKITIEIIEGKKENHTLTIYSSIGQLTKIIKTNKNIFTVDNKDIANGLYFYQIQRTTDKKVIGQGKFIKE